MKTGKGKKHDEEKRVRISDRLRRKHKENCERK
jgi:hypothetical protein